LSPSQFQNPHCRGSEPGSFRWRGHGLCQAVWSSFRVSRWVSGWRNRFLFHDFFAVCEILLLQFPGVWNPTAFFHGSSSFSFALVSELVCKQLVWDWGFASGRYDERSQAWGDRCSSVCETIGLVSLKKDAKHWLVMWWALTVIFFCCSLLVSVFQECLISGLEFRRLQLGCTNCRSWKLLVLSVVNKWYKRPGNCCLLCRV